jgi:hypothetical protein
MSRAAPPEKEGPPSLAGDLRPSKRLRQTEYRSGHENTNARSLRRAISREESYLQLVTRLTREFAPIPVKDLVSQHPGATPHELVMMVTRAWRRLHEEARCPRQDRYP